VWWCQVHAVVIQLLVCIACNANHWLVNTCPWYMLNYWDIMVQKYKWTEISLEKTNAWGMYIWNLLKSTHGCRYRNGYNCHRHIGRSHWCLRHCIPAAMNSMSCCLDNHIITSCTSSSSSHTNVWPLRIFFISFERLEDPKVWTLYVNYCCGLCARCLRISHSSMVFNWL
jgi:hypothetical protein